MKCSSCCFFGNAGARFKGCKVEATLKLAFGAEYCIVVALEGGALLGGKATIVTRSPHYFEESKDQVSAAPLLKEQDICLSVYSTVNNFDNASIGMNKALGPPSAAREPSPKRSPSKVVGASITIPSAPIRSPATPVANVNWEPRLILMSAGLAEGGPLRRGVWQCQSEAVSAKQRASMVLTLTLEGLGSVHLPLMTKVYAAGILTPAADAATASGEPLSHIRVDLHRNPFTEALDVSDIRYVAEDAGR